jgi:uncharacterized membrane protein
MKPMLALILWVLGVLSSSQLAWAAAYPFTTIQVPGSGFTDPLGINDAGNVVGTFYNTSLQPPQHGFEYNSITGVFTTIDAPGASSYSTAAGINNSGQTRVGPPMGSWTPMVCLPRSMFPGRFPLPPLASTTRAR